jgi:hypothetical protein
VNLRGLSDRMVVRWGEVHLLASPLDLLPITASVLSDRERRCWARLPPSRRADWCAGRFLVRRLVTEVFDVPSTAVDLLAAPTGAPVLSVARGLLAPAVSLSHAGGWLVAATCLTGSVGVDVCTVANAPRVRRAAQLVFSGPERIRLGAMLRSFDAASAWALAEASAKAVATATGNQPAFWQPLQRAEIYALDPPAISDGLASVWSLPGAAVAAVHTGPRERHAAQPALAA